MGPVENMTVGYLVPKRRFQLGSAASICARNGCPGVATMKSLLKPTGLVCAQTIEGLSQSRNTAHRNNAKAPSQESNVTECAAYHNCMLLIWSRKLGLGRRLPCFAEVVQAEHRASTGKA